MACATSTCRRRPRKCGAPFVMHPRQKPPSRRPDMYSFNHHRPATLDEASKLLGSADDPKLVAGGMTLLPTLKQRLAQPSDLIDLAAVPGLVGIKVEGSSLTIGAMTTHAAVHF